MSDGCPGTNGDGPCTAAPFFRIAASPPGLGHKTGDMATGDTAIVVSRRQANLVFVAILLGTLVAALDQTIVTTALATIVSDLGGAGFMSWVVSAYLLAEAVSTVLAKQVRRPARP
nr:hypothetical protein GCM10020092_056770 [Actinoplanes digitatis]